MKNIWLILLVISNLCLGQDDIESVLDQFHQAAAQADGERYFSLLDEDSIFLGTDASERWNKKAFQAFAEPYFSKGKGWSYRAVKRHINTVIQGEVVFFDELLENASYGLCRGSGVVVKRQGQWKILQYNLSIPVPNNVAKDVVSIIGHVEQLPKGE